METNELEPKKGNQQGIPFWAAASAILILAVASITVLAYVLHKSTSDKARLEKQAQDWELEKAKVEIDRQKATEQAKLAVARTHQTDALSQVRVATNACGKLLQSVQDLDRDAAGLRTNDVGKQAARFPDLVVLARRLYDVDLKAVTSQATAIAKLEGERLLENQLVNAAGTAFEPDTAFTSTAQTDTLWANQEIAKVQQIRSLLTTITTEAKVKIPPSDSIGLVTLEAAIAALNQSEATAHERVIATNITNATVVATKAIAAAEAEKIVKEAQIEAARILAVANAKVTKQAQDQSLLEAQQQVESNKVKIAIGQAADEARKVQLRARLTDPTVMSQLSPFTTPGYLQVDGRNSYEKRPLSYKGLVQSGALNADDSGLSRIVHLLVNGNDKVRPRSRFPVAWKNKPEERERVMAMQRLLVELGPIMVEQGLLDP